MFEQDRPGLLERLTGGVKIRSFLNVELPKIVARRVDLAMMLENDTAFHLEFQGKNEKLMVYRMGLYSILLGQTMPWKQVRGVVLYVGEAKMSMRNEFKLGLTHLGYELIDIREIDADMLISSESPGDNVLALLAGGGNKKVKQIVQRLGRLGGHERDHALAQLELLAGLRGVVKEIQLEVGNMGHIIDVKKNPILMEVQRQYVEQVRQAEAEARAQGLAQGKLRTLELLIETKFGPTPKWAKERLQKAKPAQLERWTKKILVADTLEGVIGKR